MSSTAYTRRETSLGGLASIVICLIGLGIGTLAGCGSPSVVGETRLDLPSGKGTIERFYDDQAQVVCYIYSHSRSAEGGIFCLPYDDTALDR